MSVQAAMEVATDQCAAVGRDAATVRGADNHHFKKSPTLLFDILTEPDKDKQQKKLQRASIAQSTAQTPAQKPPSSLPSTAFTSDIGSAPAPQLQQPPLAPHSHPVPVPLHRSSLQRQQQSGPCDHPAESRRALGPGTPDPLYDRHATAASGSSGEGLTPAGSSCLAGSGLGTQRESSGIPRVSDIGLAGTCAGKQVPSTSEQQQHVQRHQPEEQAGVQEQRAEPAAAEGAKQAEESAVPGAVAAAANATDPASAVVPPPAPPVDLLSLFTPRVILEELLGELFVPPELLKTQGTFGQGAFATVQSCSLEDPGGGPNLLVAVKSLKPEVLADMEDLRRFLLEANLVRKLRHPNIVSIHGLGAHDLTSLESLRRSAFLVMEALQGGDLRMMVLRQMTGRSPAYSRLDALRWCLHIAAACAYLHETCRPMIIHRDLKLENVMLTGGPVDNQVAKITDFGLHKRARYSRTEDVLIAVTNEWSTHGGSVYRTRAAGTPGAAGRPDTYRDASIYNGSAVDASYYGGNMFGDGGLMSGASLHRAATGLLDSSNHLGANNPTNNNRSASSRYVALATAGMAAAAATATPGPGTAGATQGVGGAVRGGAFFGAGGSGGGVVGTNDGGGSTTGKLVLSGDGMTGFGADLSIPLLSAARVSSTAPGDSLRAGSEAAAELGLPGQKAATERERPYLLAYDKRYDTPPSASKYGSTNDLTGIYEASIAAAAAAAAVVAGTATSPVAAVRQSTPFGTDAVQQQHQQQPPPPAAGGGSSATAPLLHSGTLGGVRSAQLPAGWVPPNVVPPSVEESVHRKMLALMALESAAAATTMTGGAAGCGGSRADTAGPAPTPTGKWSGADDGGGDTAELTAAAPTAPFSVTEFVRAAAAVPMEGVGPGGPSALMLMRSMSLALQQQQQQQQLSTGPHGPTGGTGGGSKPEPSSFPLPVPAPVSPPVSASALNQAPSGLLRGMRTASQAMKTVPEHNRMSMDLGGVPKGVAATSPTGRTAGRAGSSWKPGEGAPSGTASVPVTAAGGGGGGGKRAAAASRREKAIAAAARMADATCQVGSLIYMAPELVVSGSYNEKVDVFSFAIIAYELFTGKLLAMKVANEFALQQMDPSFTGPRGGTGPVPVAGTRSAEADAEAGVMAYVMRRSKAGAREALPGWWPSELRSLVGRCWAQDPADRPCFSQIHRELRRLQMDGTLRDMDAKDPLRDTGCGCTVS